MLTSRGAIENVSRRYQKCSRLEVPRQMPLEMSADTIEKIKYERGANNLTWSPFYDLWGPKMGPNSMGDENFEMSPFAKL